MNSVNDDMSNSEAQELTEMAWRRGLSPGEQARLRQWLAGNPQARRDWECEAALTRALNRLPPAPVSSNFTALVMQAAQRAPARGGWRGWLDLDSWLPRGWRARVALGTAMVCLSLMTALEYQAVEIQRQRTARELASVGKLATLQPVDWLQNFHTIESLSRVEVADDALLEALR